MAWTTMHYAVGMGCSGAAATGLCLVLRRGWRWVPAVMTLGGVWALIPDMPRILRNDFPSPWLSEKSMDRFFNNWGDLFFFHRSLDSQPHEYALHGLIVILLLYNISIAGLMWLESSQRNSSSHRVWSAHRKFIEHKPDRTRHRRDESDKHDEN